MIRLGVVHVLLSEKLDTPLAYRKVGLVLLSGKLDQDHRGLVLLSEKLDLSETLRGAPLPYAVGSLAS